MYVYLSKKIAIPHGLKLTAIAWNHGNSNSGGDSTATSHNYISCGGANGLLKVLKLESSIVNTTGGKSSDDEEKQRKQQQQQQSSTAASTALQQNQTLEGHNGNLQVIIWNHQHQKLTSSDQYGMIIVWMLHNGMWYEEMINNRNKSTVTDMKWTVYGDKICIIYADGAIIVGSVDGNRLWGKELVDTELRLVEW